jgi:hypothetical protein
MNTPRDEASALPKATTMPSKSLVKLRGGSVAASRNGPVPAPSSCVSPSVPTDRERPRIGQLRAECGRFPGGGTTFRPPSTNPRFPIGPFPRLHSTPAGQPGRAAGSQRRARGRIAPPGRASWDLQAIIPPPRHGPCVGKCPAGGPSLTGMEEKQCPSWEHWQ